MINKNKNTPNGFCHSGCDKQIRTVPPEVLTSKCIQRDAWVVLQLLS